MGILEKLFGKKPSKENAIEALRLTINRLELNVRNYDRKAEEMREKARIALQRKQKALAKRYFRRYKRYLQYSERFYKYIDILEDKIATLESATTLQDLNKAILTADRAIEGVLRGVAPEKIMGRIAQSQELDTRIRTSEEIMEDYSDSIMESEGDIEMDEEFQQLEAEVAKGMIETPAESTASKEETSTGLDFESLKRMLAEPPSGIPESEEEKKEVKTGEGES